MTVDSQRLDKWLWFARVVKTRTLAATLVSDGQVRINKVRAEKPAAIVKPGDVLTIGVRGRVRILEVRATGDKRGAAADAALLFADLTPPPAARETIFEAAPNGERDAGAGRPTKRDRRQTDRLKGDPMGNEEP